MEHVESKSSLKRGVSMESLLSSGWSVLGLGLGRSTIMGEDRLKGRMGAVWGVREVTSGLFDKQLSCRESALSEENACAYVHVISFFSLTRLCYVIVMLVLCCIKF